jgi:hypothetical protein
MTTLADELLDVVRRLPDEQQRRVLDYALKLELGNIPSYPPNRATLLPGTPASELLKFQPTLTPEEAESMRRAIEEGCEQIEPDED